MDLRAYSIRDLQHCRGIVRAGITGGLTIAQLADAIDRAIGPIETKTQARRKTVAARCPVCDAPAAKVPVNTNPGNRIGGTWTHALQCLNRPRDGQRWRPEHCGHTEYIVETR